RDGLDLLAAVTVDRDRLHTVFPRLDVRVHDVVDGRGLGQIHRLRNCARNKWLDGAHHLDVADVTDGAPAVRRDEGAVEHREVFVLDLGRALDRALLLDVRGDR